MHFKAILVTRSHGSRAFLSALTPSLRLLLLALPPGCLASR
jgi:hypothetical protein